MNKKTGFALVIFLSLSSAILGAFGFWTIQQLGVVSQPLPKWAAATLGDPAEANIAFDENVKKQFADGIATNTFIPVLHDGGFNPDWGTNSDGTYSASRKDSDFPCTVTRRISWKVNDGQTVHSIRGILHSDCGD